MISATKQPRRVDVLTAIEGVFAGPLTLSPGTYAVTARTAATPGYPAVERTDTITVGVLRHDVTTKPKVVAPGQVVALYDGDALVGSGVVSSASRN